MAAEIGGTYRQADVATPETARALVSAIVRGGTASRHPRQQRRHDPGHPSRRPGSGHTGDLGRDLRRQRHCPLRAHERGGTPSAECSWGRRGRQHRVAGRNPGDGFIDSVRREQGGPASPDSTIGRRAGARDPRQRRGARAGRHPLDRRLDAARAVVQSTTPMHRVARPDDVAHLVLAQVASTLVTGEVWVVDSGLQLVR